MTEQDYVFIQRDVLYDGVFCLARYTLRHRLFNGEWSNVVQREVLERLSAAAVLLYDPILDKVVLIEQFRPGPLTHSQNPWLLEIVAGVFDTDETPEEVALREAEEEAGCTITHLLPICDYFVSPGGSNEYLHIYCGKVDASKAEGIYGLQHEDEDIRVFNIPAKEAFTYIQAGRIKNAPAIIALQWLELNHERLKKDWGN